MHLPDFVLLVLGTLAAIAAGLAVLTANYRVARVLMWIGALAFGSLGVVWSATSDGYSLRVQMAVSAIIAAIAASGLTWVLYEIGEKEKVSVGAPPSSKEDHQNTSKETATSTDVPVDSKLTAKGVFTLDRGSTATLDNSKIVGELPFGFAVGDRNSRFSADGVIFDMSGKTLIIPYPDGRLSKESDINTLELATATSQQLRNEFDTLMRDFAPYNKPGDTANWNANRDMRHQIVRQHEEAYFKSGLPERAYEVTVELAYRLRFSDIPQENRLAVIVLTGKLYNYPALVQSADFIDKLASMLRRKDGKDHPNK